MYVYIHIPPSLSLSLFVPTHVQYTCTVHMKVCMHVFECAYVHVFVYTYTYTHIHECIYVYNAHTHTLTSTHTHNSGCVWACVDVFVFPHNLTNTYICKLEHVTV